MAQQPPASAVQGPAFLQVPALAPPPGVAPNFTDPEDKGPTLIIVGAILLALVVISLANRAYTKTCIVRKLSWDDLTVSLSAVCAIVWYTVCVLQVRIGVIGRHQYEVLVGDMLDNSFIIPSYTVLVLNGPTLWITKLTFFLLYLQIFRPMRWMRISVYLGATLSTVFYWTLSIILFALASPRPGETWVESVMASSRVVFATKVNIAVSVGGLLVDVWLFVLPLVAVYKLQLHRNRKVGLTIIFSTGLIAVAASAVSIYFRYKTKHDDDKTWAGLDVELLYLVEVDVGIITACMPSFAKMLHYHLPPWATLKSRLKFNSGVSLKEGSKRDLVMVHKGVQPTDLDRYRADNLSTHGTISGAGVELESLESVNTYFGTALGLLDHINLQRKCLHPTSYEAGVSLKGVIYLHRITDIRHAGSSVKTLEMLKKICRRVALKNVLLVSTRWNEVDEALGADPNETGRRPSGRTQH